MLSERVHTYIYIFLEIDRVAAWRIRFQYQTNSVPQSFPGMEDGKMAESVQLRFSGLFHIHNVHIYIYTHIIHGYIYIHINMVCVCVNVYISLYIYTNIYMYVYVAKS